MSKAYRDEMTAYINDVVSHIPQKLLNECDGKKAPDIAQFVRQYYAHTPVAQLQQIEPERACQRALSGWTFIQQRKEGFKLRIFQPEKKRDGWNSHHTIIQTLQRDMPFLVDSLTAELNRQGFVIFSCLHPIMPVQRNNSGSLSAIGTLKNGQPEFERDAFTPESLIDFEISTPGDEADAAKLQQDLERVMRAVEVSVNDWQSMAARVDETVQHLRTVPSRYTLEDMTEVIDFLHWMQNNHFVFLGVVDYEYDLDAKADEVLKTVAKSELGLFRLDDLDLTPKSLQAIPASQWKAFLRDTGVAEITKANYRSIVHRPIHMDYVSVKQFGSDGTVVGERRFLGLFTSLAYFDSVRNIPIIRRKVDKIRLRAGFSPNGHDGKALSTILEFYPRDEMFQISEDELFETSLGILSLESRPRVKIFARMDRFSRFASCLIYVPRERFSTDMRFKIQNVLAEAFSGTISAYYTQVTDSPLARLHIIVKLGSGKRPTVDLDKLNRRLAEVVNAWTDSLLDALLETYGDNHGEKTFRVYGKAFPDSYKSRYNVQQAISDIFKIEEALRSDEVTLNLYDGAKGEDKDIFHLKLYTPRRQIALSDILPMLENMGLKVLEEIPSHITPMGTKEGVWVRDFRIMLEQGEKPDIKALKPLFEETLLKVWKGETENDRFNALVVSARINWRDAVLLRAYAKYLKQTRFAYSEDAIEDALNEHPAIAVNLINLFHARFNPKLGDNDEGRQQGILVELEHQLANVSDVTDDRILRHYIAIMRATLRTNFYQRDKAKKQKSYLSFKFRPADIPGMPRPLPYAEIFVYSRRTEGVHLRGGKVARGGLRWSDRHEDFRTEVLGLMKAQMVKNAVIVPEGSKGGFVVKHPPLEGGREALMEEVIHCYKTFLSGLLDLTDNLVKHKIVPPKEVVRQDGDDPYLVVAADKGTATFSDIANSVAEAYGFWLGDAFASGGSAGYDHKKMGITAKGAWVSVHRHFMEMGLDTQADDFTVVGIGDMSGDVFGNGMLLSKHIKLIAAFNHLHIFIDPNPDPATSFKERQRLFALPRSSWSDYDRSILSRGGMIFERNAKQLTLNKTIQKLFDIEKESVTPEELIQHILTAEVDLLWNGGIGTYVKAAQENHEDAGDRANDTLRVNGRDLRCKVVGEGGNLGFTQLGRIEYALRGGRLNTDAIDNSAGVDCSDHEVNIKIALSQAVEDKTLSRKQRDTLLEKMTDTVEKLCLRDNELQTQAITIAQIQGHRLLESQARVMRMLEREGLLDRALEYLPDDEAIEQRIASQQGLTRPELSVLLSYSKLALYQDLIHSNVPDSDYFTADLRRYFPEQMQQKFAKYIESHQLRREIIATVITNSIVNRIGSTFFFQVTQDTGMKECDIARGYIITRDVFTLRELWGAIETLDSKVSVETQAEMFAAINRLIHRSTLWFLRNFSQPLDVVTLVDHFSTPIAQLRENLDGMLRADARTFYEERLQELKECHVPEALAKNIALLPALASAGDIIEVAQHSKMPERIVGEVYFELSARLKLGWLRQCADKLNDQTYWARQASTTFISDLFSEQRRLTARVVAEGCDENQCDIAVDRWCETHSADVERFLQFVGDLQHAAHVDFAMLVVALRKIESIAAV